MSPDKTSTTTATRKKLTCWLSEELSLQHFKAETRQWTRLNWNTIHILKLQVTSFPFGGLILKF